jgi:hypothetical protein
MQLHSDKIIYSHKDKESEIMKVNLVFSLAVLMEDFAWAKIDWVCSEKCPNYDKCMNEGARLLDSNLDAEDMGDAFLDKEPLAVGEETSDEDSSRLRGGVTAVKPAQRRNLEESTYFHLKMYHEESKDYCWQGEWEDRRWCMDCEGSKCSRGDIIEVRTCERSNQLDQQFVYEDIPGSGGGRIRPYYNQDLCFMRRSSSSRTVYLDWCKEDYDDDEIFLGFDFDKEFELIPKTLSDHCLTQEHYPRSGEKIFADDCENACNVGTCLWEVIYVTNAS